MTIKEAENIYDHEMNKFHTSSINKIKQGRKKRRKIDLVLIIVGIIIFIAGFCVPKNKYLTHKVEGYKTIEYYEDMESFFAIMVKILGVYFVVMGSSLLLINYATRNIACDLQKLRGSYWFYSEELALKKQLFLNYLRCEDITENQKAYCKQILEEIRYATMTSAIQRAAATTSATILLSSLRK